VSQSVSQDKVLELLRRVKGPDLSDNIVDLGLVSEVIIKEDRVYFSITVPANKAEELEPLRQAAEQVVQDLEGVEKVTAVLTSEAASEPTNGNAQPAAPETHPSPMQQPVGGAGTGTGPVPGIKHIVAVASGKGGVGKSTTSVNLALGLKALGLKVGILDADVYGPSLPRLMGLNGQPAPAAGEDLHPMEGHGLKVMSMGFLVDEAQPMIWRGPMVMSALTQLLRNVAWGELDVLIVDMPPGTGDAQLTMAQQVPLAGAVIVSTPQDLALIDARKGLNMFKQVSVPVLGIIENMSYFLCPSCGERSDIFGHGGAEKEARKLELPFLGAVPLHMDIRSHSDAGDPVVASMPDSEHAKIYKDIAAKVWAGIEKKAAASVDSAPKIVIE